LRGWTRSPFVALFFAFEEEHCVLDDGRWSEPRFRGVYALSTSTIEPEHEDAATALRFLSPETDANYRLISQAAIFVRMPRKADLESYVANRIRGQDRAASLTKIKIPNVDRDRCLVALNKMNINHMTLFPDIDGAARHVNSLWQPGHEDSIAHI
jgi:hypothetical protein